MRVRQCDVMHSYVGPPCSFFVQCNLSATWASSSTVQMAFHVFHDTFHAAEVIVILEYRADPKDFALLWCSRCCLLERKLLSKSTIVISHEHHPLLNPQNQQTNV